MFEIPTVLLCGAVSGEEEIPMGVQAVLVRSAAVSPDILSHVAVRARNAHVLVAVCFEKKVADELVRTEEHPGASERQVDREADRQIDREGHSFSPVSKGLVCLSRLK